MDTFKILLAGVIIAFMSTFPVRADGLDGVLNTAYRIENQTVQLINGRAEEAAAPGSAVNVVTQVVNDPAFGDLDGDGQADAALFLSRQTGGSGTFYYVIAATLINSRWQGTNAIFIGDRVVPETIDIDDRVIVARFKDRRSEEPMAVTPSVPKTIEIELVDGHLKVFQPEP